MQEDVENKTVNLAVKTCKLTAQALYQGIKTHIERSGQNATVERPGGEVSVRELLKDGQGVSSIPITDEGIRDFKKICKKYGVDFAVVKDKTVEPPEYTVFFKARDADAFTSILREYSAKQLEKQERAARPSIIDMLKKFKELIANMPRKNKEKNKEQER